MAGGALGRLTVSLGLDAGEYISALGKAELTAKQFANQQKNNARDVERTIATLDRQAAVLGKTTRETQLYILAQKGATSQQLASADSALKYAENVRKVEERQKAFANATTRATNAIALFGAAAIGGFLVQFARESINAQNEVAQLDAALKSTGMSAGYTAEQLNKMAAEIAGKSIFDDGDITRAQTRLLSYTNVVGKEFPIALQAAVDMASRLGLSLEQSAELVGKALDTPAEGLTALSRQGFRFTEDQKKVIERLQDTGRTAEAQKIILDALSTAYGGAAEASRSTFGGALAGLKNQLNALATGEGGSLDGTAAAINELTKTLASPETTAAFAAITTGITTIITKLAEGATAFVNFGKFVGEGLGRMAAGADDPVSRLDDQIKNVKTRVDDLDRYFSKRRTVNVFGSDNSADRFRQELETARATLQRLQAAREQAARDANRVANATPPPPDAPLPRPVRIATPDKAAESAAKKTLADAERYIEALRKQDEKTADLTATEKVLADIQAGRFKAAGKFSEAEALRLAARLDAAKEEEFRIKAGRDAAIAAGDAVTRTAQRVAQLYEQTRTPLEKLNIEQAELYKLLELGGPAAEVAARRIFDLSEEYDKASQSATKVNDTAKEIGLAFNSAFEEAVVSGGKLGDVLNSLGQDLLKLALRKTITEPLFNAISGSGIFSSLGNLFGGGKAAGGPVDAGRLYRVNENGPEMLDVNGSQYLMMGSKGGTVRPGSQAGGGGGSLTINVGAGASRAEVIAAVQQGVATSVGMVAESNRRRGPI